jgi:predicted PurR-regulated permease PerM
MGIAAIILLPYYAKIQDRTDTASDAFGAFLTLCVIFGGLGPLVTLVLFAAQRLFRRRSTPRERQRTPISPARQVARRCSGIVTELQQKCPKRCGMRR